MIKVLQERGFGSLPNSMETNPRDQVKSISTAKDDFYEIHQAHDVKILDAYDHTLPQKEKELGSFTLPYFIHNTYFDKALIGLGASVSVMPFPTYTNLGLGILSHTRLIIKLADRTIKQPRGIAENVLVSIGKFTFLIDFIILDIPEDDDIPLILGRPFLSTAHSKIDVFKRKITLRVGEEKLVFKSIKPATSIIKRVFMIKSLISKTEEGDEPFDPTYGNYIELNNLDTPQEPKMNQDVDFELTFVKTDSYKMKISCVIGYKYVKADLLPSLLINLMSERFYYSIIKDKEAWKSHARTLINIPVFVESFSIISGFTIIDDDDMTKDVVLGMKFCKKYASCKMIMKKFSLGDKCEQIMEDESKKRRKKCMTRSSTKELLSPFENPKQKFRSRRRLFDTPSLVESKSPEFDHNFNIEEQSEEEGQFLKELRDNTFSGSKHKDANEHIEKVLEIVDLFHIPKVIQDQIMLRAFPEVILFYNGLDVPTRQILDSKGAIPSKTAVDAKIAIQEMAEYSQKWHNGTSSRTKSTETFDGLAVIQAQLNNLGREVKKVNEKVYAAHVGCELYKGPHYTKDCPQKEEGKTLEEAYYTQFGAPYQPGGQYRAAGPGFYQRNNGNSSYLDQRPSLEESLTKFMAESAKKHKENSNIIKEIRASTDAAIRNQGASIKTLEIQIR
ncbi:ribonuclease H-like domain-containing protein [Tanacetum coccineum]|uniref:Ribonuclease H-like domain-containing protein n=1 Tax=Tanacetum coccineum TaxID=301880 RepID=A0ABQ4YN75_9ASTR